MDIQRTKTRKTGIVLAVTPSYVTLLQGDNTRLDALCFFTKPSRGSIISFDVALSNQRYCIENITIEYVPLMQARQDIYFLHSLIEACYYFIPESGCEFFLYALIIKTLQNFNNISEKRIKTMIICKLYAHLGIYPLFFEKNEELFRNLLQQFLKEPIDNIILGSLELAHDDVFEKWLEWCTQEFFREKKCKALTLFLQK